MGVWLPGQHKHDQDTETSGRDIERHCPGGCREQRYQITKQYG